MKKCLVTGSEGLVGSATVKLFSEKGYEVVGIDANKRSEFYNTPSKVPKEFLDIRNHGGVYKLFSEAGPFDVIVHAAAQPSHDYSKDNVLEDFDINARGTVILLEAARRYCPNTTFIYVSSDKVYGENMRAHLIEEETRFSASDTIQIGSFTYSTMGGFSEDLPLDQTLRSPFGCSKLTGDLYVQEFGRYFGMKTACFRPSCITGKNHEGAELHGFLAYLAKCIKTGTPYKVFGYKGKQVRDQIHADDVASAFLAFAQNPKIAAVYNIGGGKDRSVSILEAIALIEQETGKQAIIEFINEPRLGDRPWDVVNTWKFRADYPMWDYKYSLQNIVTDVCAKDL